MADVVLGIKLTADGSNLEGEVRDSKKAMDSLSKSTDKVSKSAEKSNKTSATFAKRLGDVGSKATIAASAIAATAGALLAFANRSITAGDNIGKTADKLGLAVEALQELRFAAEAAGVSQETFDRSTQRFVRVLAEVANGGAEGSKEVKELGISLQNSAGQMRPAEALLGDVAEAMSKIEDPAKRLRIAVKLFDTEGAAMVNLLAQGRQSLDDMRQAARDMGAVMDETMVRKAEEARTKLDAMSRVIGTQLNSALISLSPLLLKVSQGFALSAKWAGDLFDTFRDIENRTDIDALNKRLGFLQEKMLRIRRSGTNRDKIIILPGVVKEIAEVTARLVELQKVEPDVIGQFNNDLVALRGTMAEQAAAAAVLAKEQKSLLDELFPEDAAFNKYAKQLNTLATLQEDGTLSTKDYQEAVDRLTESYLGFGDESEKVATKVAANTKRMGTEISATMRQVQLSTGRMLQASEDAFANFVETGKLGIRDLATTMIDEMARVFFRQQAAGAVGGLFSSLFAGFSTAGTAAQFGTTPGSQQTIQLQEQQRGFHGGGIVGRDGIPRFASAALFDNAPRMHLGGLAGDEVPAILRRGEEVLTADNPRHRNNATDAMKITQNITIDARGADAGVDARIEAAMVRTKVETIAAFKQEINRGGSTARIVGRRK